MRRRRYGLFECIRRDFASALSNDPAARGPFAALEVALTYPGFHATVLHRFTHEVYKLGIPFLPKAMSMLNRFLTGIEIHQAAQIGPGFFIDHGMGVVVGETAIVGEDCMLFHGVTLGGTGKATGKRHPTLLNGVVVGAGAKVLGNITVGNNCYVGANSVVLKDVPDNSTVVGIPGRVVARDGKRVNPCEHALDHNLPDPILDRFRALEARLAELEKVAELNRV
ncbi:serine O-acetyltransferase [bacterium]|nr:serine O-acetyltransferase [bacterium]